MRVGRGEEGGGTGYMYAGLGRGRVGVWRGYVGGLGYYSLHPQDGVNRATTNGSRLNTFGNSRSVLASQHTHRNHERKVYQKP